MGQNKRYGDPLTALDPPAIAPPARVRPQHVWVNLSTVKHAPTLYPGVLVEWRPHAKGWEAMCTWVTPEGGIHAGWVSSEKLTPAQSQGEI